MIHPVPRLVLRFDRLHDDTLVATASHEGRSVAAIVHPPRLNEDDTTEAEWENHWSLAGDTHETDTVHGMVPGHRRRHVTCAEAAHALGESLGVIVAGYEVAP